MGWLRDGFQQVWGSWSARYNAPPITLGLGQTGLRVATWGAGGGCRDYATMYRTHPFIRTCVDFLARNVAQLPLHTYERLPDDSRERVRGTGVAALLEHPNPLTTPYQFINRTVTDVCIYGYALWVKVRDERGTGLQLARVPPEGVRPVYVGLDGEALPGIEWRLPSGYTATAALRDLVHFHLYDTDPTSLGLSPLASLCGLYDIERASMAHMNQYWASGARPSGVIGRPLDAPRWTPPNRKQFVDDLYDNYTGPGAAGRVLVLEDGMTYQAVSHNASESQLLDWHKQAREEIAGVYQIPAQSVGILDGSMSYASAKEMHKVLYQDTLGPWLAMIEQEIDRALVPEFPDSDTQYVEFVFEEKLRGTGEEQALAVRMLTGTPVLSVNEARARFNLPRLEGEAYDTPVIPLNLAAGDVNEARELAKQFAGGNADGS